MRTSKQLRFRQGLFQILILDPQGPDRVLFRPAEVPYDPLSPERVLFGPAEVPCDSLRPGKVFFGSKRTRCSPRDPREQIFVTIEIISFREFKVPTNSIHFATI